jgi:hypothetical protein
LLLTALTGVVEKTVAGTPGGSAGNLVADELLGRLVVFGNNSLDILAIVFVWLLHGFAAGQLCALVFRKPVVAAAMAVLGGGLALALCYLYTLRGGEVAFWQLLVAPLVLLATTRAVVWPWMTGRLYTGRALATLLGGVLLAGGAIAVSLWYQFTS